MGMLSNRDNIKLWVKERDAAVSTLDIDTFKEFYAKWHRRGVYAIPPHALPSDDVLEISIRKMAYHSPGVDPAIRAEAEKWLYEHGSDTKLDGGM